VPTGIFIHPGHALAAQALPLEFSMSRRNFFIRTVVAVAGDLAVGAALAAACSWIIQAAALSAFLGFLAWMVAILATLALSQCVVHPAVQFVLSDRKLDRSLHALSSLVNGASDLSADLGPPSWGQLRAGFGRFAGAFAAK